MDRIVEQISSIDPILSERDRGGWLATSPKRAIIRIGVTGESELDARYKFKAALSRWAAARDSDTTGGSLSHVKGQQT